MTGEIAYKANSLIEASYKLTLQEQRFLLVCISKLSATATQSSTAQKTMTITARELLEAFPDIGMGNAESALMTAIDGMWDRSIILRGKSKVDEFRWIQRRARYLTGEGKVEITFSDAVIPYLTQLTEQFTRIVMSDVSGMSSVYSIRLYELLQQFRSTGDRVFQLDDFRRVMCVEGKFLEFKVLNRDLLKPAIAEINAMTDLAVIVDMIRTARKITALHFRFKKTPEVSAPKIHPGLNSPCQSDSEIPSGFRGPKKQEF